MRDRFRQFEAPEVIGKLGDRSLPSELAVMSHPTISKGF